ncbi:D-2-hydroxyacid dehydrogenase [Emticicia sp. 21SJ11W-3]|uniref:D-2-hydroxyacid dehydrogenase n=1 Tax=Emticicia sp. 21SJ11W-3 TaxID=2916755 RepID=UPI00209E71E8|nr:D-2-hydroxyacid dehydrogenase [Emticicia sp. 21SJ11W-3]UTA68303.1 D-2-hydroxyacid dehydrogenase [Emticicia sp. 21SJ11W-3]
MKIVYLDAHTIDILGDLDLSVLNDLGEVTLYDRTPKEQIIERAKDAEVILTNKCPLDKDTISQLPDLKYIGVTATGYNIVDVAAAKEQGIIVTNVRGYSSASVAQLTFALLLSFTNRVAQHANNIDQTWPSSADWCFYHSPLIELEGKTLGIVGFGDIGKKVAGIALGFGMKVLANKRDLTKGGMEGVELCEVEKILKESDFLTLHCPLTTANQGFINQASIGLMKPNAVLINTSRGGLINEPDLAHALNAGQIAGAGLDVLSTEPPAHDNPLLKAQNCIITPHIAWAGVDARKALLNGIANNIAAYQKGQPVNVVS